MQGKKLYRSNRDKKLAGVCAGIAEYFEIDPTMVRIATVVLAFTPFPVVLAYILFALIIPIDPNDTYVV